MADECPLPQCAAMPVDLVDEIHRLAEAYQRTGNIYYIAEARCRLDAAGERLARCRDSVAAIEAEIERVRRVAAEEARR